MGTGWRLQELPDTERKHVLSDTPQFGRRYDVFYNQVRLGTLEVSPGAGYDAKNPDVHTSVQVEWVRLLPIGTIRAFLNGIALHVCRPDPITKEYGEARAAIEESLTDALWQTQQISEYELEESYGELKLYPVHVTTRKSLGLMMRKLSVTESQRSAQFRGTFSRRKPSVASANWVQVA